LTKHLVNFVSSISLSQHEIIDNMENKMTEIVKGNMVYTDGVPTFFGAECRTLRRCPHCKSKKYSKDILIHKSVYWNDDLQKYVTTTVHSINGTESGFSCLDCKIQIDYQGTVTFDQRRII